MTGSKQTVGAKIPYQLTSSRIQVVHIRDTDNIGFGKSELYPTSHIMGFD